MANNNKKQIVKFKGIDYQNTFGDYVYCPNCKKMEVIPLTAAYCPKCGEEVLWAEDDKGNFEVEMKTLNDNFEVIEDEANLTTEDLFK